jgi:N-methylhydantoinase A
LHATALARELEMSTVVVPPAPGALAALGLLIASRRADASLSRPLIAEPAHDGELRTVLDELTEKVVADLLGEGVASGDGRVERFVDCRYLGQSHELRVAAGDPPSFVRIVEAFHAAHRERYGFDRTDVGVEAVTFRASALGPLSEVVVPSPGAGTDAPVTVALVGTTDIPVYERSSLASGRRIDGPAIVRELDSTTWLDDASSATVHASGALVVDVR